MIRLNHLEGFRILAFESKDVVEYVVEKDGITLDAAFELDRPMSDAERRTMEGVVVGLWYILRNLDANVRERSN